MDKNRNPYAGASSYSVNITSINS